jgi:hypothetical protein
MYKQSGMCATNTCRASESLFRRCYLQVQSADAEIIRLPTRFPPVYKYINLDATKNPGVNKRTPRLVTLLLCCATVLANAPTALKPITDMRL